MSLFILIASFNKSLISSESLIPFDAAKSCAAFFNHAGATKSILSDFMCMILCISLMLCYIIHMIYYQGSVVNSKKIFTDEERRIKAAERSKKYREENPLKAKEWRENNKDKIKEYSREYSIKNSQIISERGKKYRENNSEKIKEYMKNYLPGYAKKYRENNKEKITAYKANYYKNNKSYMNAYQSKWRKQNRYASRAYCHNMRERKRANGGVLSRNLAKKLFVLQKGKCPCCRKPLGKDYQMDHIMPLALGGVNEDYNIQLLTSKCNKEKHAKHPFDFMQSRGFLF